MRELNSSAQTKARETMKKPSVEQIIGKARDREYNDDHLSDKERKEIVELYKENFADDSLPEDITEAFIYIIYQ